jgi:alkylation response protein AidB-like acyl-CoA dehydrogenase
MDFTFTEEQRMMANAFRELMDDICSPAKLRAAVHSASDGPREAWRRMAELGITGALAPDAAGGLGLTTVDFILVAEEAGRAALQEPIIEHACLAVPMLAELTGQSTILLRAAAGAIRLAIGHPINPFVLGAAEADYLLLAQGDEIHLMERERARLTPVDSIDAGRRLCRVESLLSSATLIASGDVGREALQRAFERGALFCAAQSLGLCQRMIELAVAYGRERKQFGKPIGSYQAMKHALANVQVKLEFARPVVYYAATQIASAARAEESAPGAVHGETTPAEDTARAGKPSLRAQVAISHAKIAATDAADLAARTAIQVFGAMGYSWEVDLHLYMKRAWALAGAWGSRGFHARRVSSAVLEGHIALGPDHTFD